MSYDHGGDWRTAMAVGAFMLIGLPLVCFLGIFLTETVGWPLTIILVVGTVVMFCDR